MDAAGECSLYDGLVMHIRLVYCNHSLEEKKMINFIIWIIVGGIIGWLASIIMKTNSRQGLIADIIVGIVGAFVGGFFLSPLFNISTINESNYSIPALLVSLGGAIILLAISKLFRNIGGFLLVVVIALLIYIYVSCWSLESTSAFCTGVRALPFLQ
jgi:uncharacterized membrane protein YeaQ/YmgE (transglycosylase-associated protein family)